MSSRGSDIRDISLLSAACAFGTAVTAVAPGVAFVGLPLVGAGAAGLASRGRWALAAIAGLIGAMVAVLVQPAALVFVVPAVLGVLVAVALLPRVSYQVVGAALVVILAISAFGSDALAAALSGQSVLAQFSTEAATLVAELSKSIQASGGSSQVNVGELSSIASSLWPFAYVQLALLSTALVIAAIAWAARRAGFPLPVPRMAQLDLTINVIWLPVAALLLLAIGGLVGGTGLAFRIGLNLMLVARMLLLIQGLGVLAALMERGGIGSAGRGVGYVLLVGIDAFVPVVSVLGLVDFWVNFRKLPRDGESESVTPAHEGEN